MSADLGEEDNLLVEAVSLLVQRQRETEQWVTEQVCQAEERTAAAERRSVELEARLAAIEEQLARIARELEPGRAEGPGDGRLARLREQLESLKAGGDGLPSGETVREHRSRVPIPPEWRQRAASPAVREPVRDGEAVRRRASLLDLLGSDPQDRFGLVFMGVGAVAVVYAALSLLRGA